MKLKRIVSFFMAAVLCVTFVQTYPAYAEESIGSDVLPEMAEDAALEADENVLPEDGADPDQEPAPSISKAEVKNLKAVYDPATDKVSFTFERNADCQYVDIRIQEDVIVAGLDGEAYVYNCGNLDDGAVYQAEILTYDKEMKAGKTAVVSFEIKYRPAFVEEVDADYNLEKKVLIIDWDGENIKSVDIYQDDLLLAEKVSAEKLTEGRLILDKHELEANSKHTYRVVPFDKSGKAGAEKSALLEVDDYVARIENAEIDYNEIAKQITMKWEDVYTEKVSIYLNDETLVENYQEKTYSLNCVLQPGAAYVITILPYNSKGDEGEEEEEDVSYGYFEVPDEPDVRLKSKDVKDSSGHMTGFTKPAVHVSWDAQASAVYEIYRATKNKKNAYTWIANVKPEKEGYYTYVDEKVDFETYYYKVRRKITKDAYTEQELFTALSDADGVKVHVPKPEARAELNKDGNTVLTMDCKKDFVSGFDIYRKSGSENYKKIATITESVFTDKNMKFGRSYSYKVKAYYYDTEKNKKVYSAFSKNARVKNTVSGIEAQAVAVSEDTVKLSWTPSANVKEYEIYYKTGTQGDSYVLLKKTKQTSLKQKFSKSGNYTFMVKACQTTASGKTYFTSVEVSCKMGFSAPRGVKKRKTSYEINSAANQIIQKDTISWNRVYGAKGYEIEVYNPVTKKYQRIAKIKSDTKTSYTVSNPVIANAQSIKYRVNAYAGKSKKKGDSVEIVPVLGKVKQASASSQGKKVKISWKGVVGAEAYQVYRSNGRTMLLIGKTEKTSLTDMGVSADISYQYYVEAVNVSQNLVSEKSAPASFKAKPEKMSSLEAENKTSGTVQLKWKSVKGARSYVIYYKTSSSAKYEKIAEVPAKQKSYEHKDLPVGATGYYKVTAKQVNSGGISVETKPSFTQVKISR